MIETRAVAVLPIDAGVELPAEAGGKAEGLRQTLRAGLAVPPAWCVLPGGGDDALRALADALARRGIASVAVRSSGADGEDLRLLAAALRPLVAAAEEPETAKARRARRRDDAAAAWKEVAGVHGHLVRLRVRGPARRLARLMLVREELRSAMTLQTLLSRRVGLELGRRLVDRGQLDAAADVQFLAWKEFLRAVRDPAFDARGAVARERARIAAWRRVEVPPAFRSEDVPGFPRRGAARAGAETVLRGTAVSPGEVIAPACVLRTPGDAAKMRTGGVLVAPSTDPGWMPILARSAAVVVELGGVLSHAATVAREYGLPCVSNVDGATRRLRDGDLLRVDGTHGVVEVVARAP